MTAIATLYDHVKKQFVVSADGRVGMLEGGVVTVVKDDQQKIYPYRYGSLNAALCFTGMARIGDLDIVQELRNQTEKLSKRKFNSGYEFAEKVAFNLKKVVEKSFKDEHTPTLTLQSRRPGAENGRFLKIVLLGFYGPNPFRGIYAFYFHENTKAIEYRKVDDELRISDSSIACMGCEIVSDMLFGGKIPHPELVRYKRKTESVEAVDVMEAFIEACSHPITASLDPSSRLIGGQISTVVLTQREFRWASGPNH